MTLNHETLVRSIRVAVLTLLMVVTSTAEVLAQASGEGEGETNPVFGYIAAGFISVGIIFFIGMSSRR